MRSPLTKVISRRLLWCHAKGRAWTTLTLRGSQGLVVEPLSHDGVKSHTPKVLCKCNTASTLLLVSRVMVLVMVIVMAMEMVEEAWPKQARRAQA